VREFERDFDREFEPQRRRFRFLLGRSALKASGVPLNSIVVTSV
jgi:hypothetical protein